MKEENPKVFVSYCQESLEFSDKVLKFSNGLRDEGIDVILDQYEESPLEGWPRWMENSISDSDFILIVCTKEYLERLMLRTNNGVGKGVKWESAIIYQHIYNDETINQRFIPVVFDHQDTKHIPMPLQGTTYYNVSNNEIYDKLYWRLRGVKQATKPELGKLRPLPQKERKSLFISTPIDIETWDKAIWRGAAFLLDPTNEGPPCFLLPFANEKAAIKIFKDWNAFYGKEDKDNEIRIALIEGEIPGESQGYSIHISPNIDRVIERVEKMGTKETSLIMSISRIQRANPTDDFKMYNMFKSQFKVHKAYLLAPVIVDEKLGRMKPLIDLGIMKKDIIFKSVDDIDENDIDYAVLGRKINKH